MMQKKRVKRRIHSVPFQMLKGTFLTLDHNVIFHREGAIIMAGNVLQTKSRRFWDLLRQLGMLELVSQ